MSSLDISSAGSGNVGRVSAPAAAIRVTDATKVYRLYGSLYDQVLDSLGVHRLLFWRNSKTYQEFHALRGVTLNVNKGERLGIIGRNGAGKTTLLKLVTRNFAPTSGAIEVNGTVQALMQTGLGFHPEFSGYENIRSALHYNGLVGAEFANALADVVEFVELEDFLQQPMKTYSGGMIARVQFAAATAIKPDILIVDEVLGAGDAYFSRKSAHRMENLTSSGCTLLLVSHSMQQVLQFCERAVWLEEGSIVLASDSLHVVKAYEEYTQKLEKAHEFSRADQPSSSTDTNRDRSPLSKKWLKAKILEQVLGGHVIADPVTSDAHGRTTPGGISRWESTASGLRISAVRVLDSAGELLNVVHTGEPICIELAITAEQTGIFPCYGVVLIFSEDGTWLSRHCSERFELSLEEGETCYLRLRYPETLLGNGRYTFSAAIYRTLDLKNLSTATFYELLGRSFELVVNGPYRDDLSIFYHPGDWVLMTQSQPKDRKVV